jgi:hypothetical protein
MVQTFSWKSPNLPLKNCVLTQSRSDTKENMVYHVWLPNCSIGSITVVGHSVIS